MTTGDRRGGRGEPPRDGVGGASGDRGGPLTGGELPRIVEPPPGPHSRELGRRLREVESRNVTFLTPGFPVFWSEARGANVRDADGNLHLDLTGAFGVAVAGHSNARVTDAIRTQAGTLAHGMGDVHPPVGKVALLERLVSLAPWPDGRATLASSGSEAVEIGLKTAELATGRSGVLAFQGGYHGLTLGALAVTSREDFRTPFRRRLHGGVAFAPFPAKGGLDRSLTAVKRILDEGAGGHPIGAVIVEPIQGRAGVRVPPPGFLGELARLARGRGAVLIFDEIFTGLGRTGTLFAFEEEGVEPDLLLLGKALGGGLPLSACVGPARVMDAWPPSGGEALHTSTFLGHPLACAASLALLAEVEERDLPTRARRLGTRLVDGLRGELRRRGIPGRVRGRGLFVGIELADGPEGGRDEGSQEQTVRGRPGAGVRSAVRGLSRGLLLLPAGDRGEVVELAPPLVLTPEQVDYAVEALGEVLAAEATSLRR